jgi:DNA gyrase inhibitor GyrI
MIQINNIYDSNQKQGFKNIKNSPINETNENLMKENNENEMRLIKNSIIDKY